MRTKFVLSCLLLVFSCCCFGQEPLEPFVEGMTEDAEPAAAEALNWELENFRRHPLDLNRLERSDLEKFPFLSAIQIEKFFLYRKLAGPFVSIFEIQAIPGWDEVTCNRMRPYIVVTSGLSPPAKISARHSITFKASTSAPQLKTGADDLHVLMRYRVQRGKYEGGWLAEKDAGENIFDKRRGWDFYSAHLALRLEHFQIIVGDYSVNLGQGLIGWQSFSFGKTAEAMTIKKQAPVIAPYRSASEYNFSRGVAACFSKKKWKFTAFASRLLESAHVDDSLQNFQSFQLSGYHRTEGELADRNRVVHRNYGGSFSFESRGWIWTLNGTRHVFSKALARGDEAYQYFMEEGKSMKHVSMNFSYGHRNLHWFGEMGWHRKRLAGLTGILISTDKKLDLSVLVRVLPPRFQSMFGKVFSENTLPSNEYGCYVGMNFHPKPAWTIQMFSDQFIFPWLKYRMDKPSSGSEQMMTLLWKPARMREIGARVRFRRGWEQGPGGEMHVQEWTRTMSLRIYISSESAGGWRWQTRMEMNEVKGEGEETGAEGFMIYQDIGFKVKKAVSVRGRLQYFDTEGYRSRIYAYENDLFNGVAIPAVFGRGVRGSMSTRMQISDQLQVAIQVAGTRKTRINNNTSDMQSVESKGGDLSLLLHFSF